MKVKFVSALLLACALVAAASAGATTPKPAAKKPFDKRFACATIAPPALMTSLAGGFGGTYTLKPADALAGTGNHVYDSTGGVSACDYFMSASPPGMDKASYGGPASVAIIYGQDGVSFYKRDLTTASQRFTAALCAQQKAQNPNLVIDPRMCAPIPIAGIGDKAYEAGSYIAVLRGHVFLSVGITLLSNTTGNVGASAELLQSMAKALLARIPTY